MLWGEGDIRLRERQIMLSDSSAARKAMERRRLSALLALCESPRCRRQTLLAAFGEDGPACGFCDFCEGTHQLIDGVVQAQKAMSAMLRTSGRFFPGHLANLLVGKVTEAISRHNHDDLPTFGIGTEHDAAGWRSVFRQIQAAGLIAQDVEDGERWLVTDKGRTVLKGEAPLELLASEDAPRRDRKARRMLGGFAADGEPHPRSAHAASGADGEALSVADERLFVALKAHRLEVARAKKLPPYVIFHDKTLRDIARGRPRDRIDLGRLPGIGPAKVGQYGDNVLAVVARFEG